MKSATDNATEMITNLTRTLNRARPALRPTSAAAPREALPDPPGLERLALGEGTDVRFEKGAGLEVRERTEERVVVAVQRGTARFRVRHDPHRVFRVHAGDVEVEDLGTAFDVEHKGSRVRVAVSEGTVSVSFPEAVDGARKTVSLKAGESGEYPAASPRAKAEYAPSSARETLPSASGAASNASPESPPPVTSWRALARSGKHRAAYELLSPGAFRDVRNEPGELLLASDVARLSRHPAEAAQLLKKLLSGHARDPRAPSAAFTLGWLLMNELGRPREAAVAFARAEALAPRGNLAEDAVARSVEAWIRAGELGRAKAGVERYRRAYPKGRHLVMLEGLLGSP
jgi:transmembrane sensor